MSQGTLFSDVDRGPANKAGQEPLTTPPVVSIGVAGRIIAIEKDSDPFIDTATRLTEHTLLTACATREQCPPP